jgi:CHAT domain-containing protein
VNSVRQLLAEESMQSLVQLVHLGRTLYRQLLAPAEAQLHRRRRLLIVPDGPLNALPFSILRIDSEEEPAETREDIRYLIQRYALRYSHTALPSSSAQAGVNVEPFPLWPVSEEASSALLSRYHRYLSGGLRSDEALRAAQQELLIRPVEQAADEGSLLDAFLALLRGKRQVDLVHPAHWASYRLLADGT